MLDIETLSTENDAVIVQISAVQFNPITGETYRTFDVNIDPQTAIDLGLNVSASTTKFWLSQSKEAIDSVFNKIAVSLHEALIGLKIFIISCSSSSDKVDTRIWGNGPSFDCSKIKSSYVALKLPLPWLYFNERCVRTIVACDSSYKKNTPFTGIKHYGLDDCKHQIKYISEGLNALLSPEVPVVEISPVQDVQIEDNLEITYDEAKEKIEVK